MGHATAVIANGQSQSNALDVFEQAVTGIKMGDAWTAASLTLLAAEKESGPFYPVYDAAGTEVSITTAASRYVALDPAGLRFRYLKLRSGTAAAAVNQGAERRIEVLFAPAGV